MENIINERYYRKTQKLILKYIDSDIELHVANQLKVLWHKLTLENAKMSYEKANKLIFPPIEIQKNVMLQ